MFERGLNIAAWLVIAFLVIPLIVIIGSSFTTTDYVAFPPVGFTLKWYEKLAGQTDFIRSFSNADMRNMSRADRKRLKRDMKLARRDAA